MPIKRETVARLRLIILTFLKNEGEKKTILKSVINIPIYTRIARTIFSTMTVMTMSLHDTDNNARP